MGSLFGSTDQSWGEDVRSAIRKGIAEGKDHFTVGIGFCPSESTQKGVNATFALEGYRVTWIRVPDFGYSVEVTKII